MGQEASAGFAAKSDADTSLRPSEPARPPCAPRQELGQGLHEGAAATLGMLTVEASNLKTQTDSRSYAGQIGRMPIVAAMNRRAWRAAGRAAPMITAGMGVDHEPIGASRHAIDVATRKEEGGKHPDLESARRPCVPQFHAKCGRATQSGDHHSISPHH